MAPRELNVVELSSSLSGRLARAYVDSVRPRSATLRRTLLDAFEPDGGAQPLIASPLIQHKFGFEIAEESVDDLSRRGLLNAALVNALDEPGENRFPRDRRPYVHQVRTWRATIEQRRSTILAAGTGSGKTEGFLVPILNDLYGAASRERRLEGVRALMLYPLNALIASQEKRLAAWTAASNGHIRYCLYNGLTPEEPAKGRTRPREEVGDRAALRASPPPILVTNATMLEYMLLRPSDQPILEKSQGKLRYVVLDEAHTYTGTQAAEIAMLIRRVLSAFGVDRKHVVFIATSATFGGAGEVELRRFMAGLSGQPETDVVAVLGRASIPQLPAASSLGWPSPDALGEMAPSSRWEAMCRSDAAQQLRKALAENPMTVAQLASRWGADVSAPQSTSGWLQFLQMAAEARESQLSEPFLPFRAHFFARTLPGLWACANPECAGRPGIRGGESDWGYGRLLFERRDRCPDCDHLVFPLTQCSGCRGEYLDCVERTGPEGPVASPAPDPFFGELDDDGTDDDEPAGGDDDAESESPLPVGTATQTRRILLFRKPSLGALRLKDAAALTREFDSQSGLLICGAVEMIRLCRDEGGDASRCAICGQRTDWFKRPFLSAPFALAVLTPTLLAALPPAEVPGTLPAGGRRLLTFTDSRQGAAWHAARRQLDSEQQVLRSVVYERLWETVDRPTSSERERLDAERRELLQSLPCSNEAVARAIRDRLAKIDAKLDPKPAPVGWRDTYEHIARNSEIARAYDRRCEQYPAYRNTVDQTLNARILLMREFGRAPRGEPSLESLGLARLDFPVGTSVPHEWKRLGGTADEWHDFVNFCLRLVCRRQDAIGLTDPFVRWIGRQVKRTHVVAPSLRRELERDEVRWPASMRSQAQAIKLLVRAFRLDTSADTSVFVSECLQAAWETSVRAGFLERAGDDRYTLNMDPSQLAALDAAWLCPATQRYFATTLRGYSPYSVALPGESSQCIKVELPRPPPRTATSEDAYRQTKAAWIRTDRDLRNLLEAGRWSEMASRVLLGEPYVVSAEHTAQVDRRELEICERRFDEGRINVLGSSTTLEMGIDLRGLSAIAMTNVPPLPANFLQRAGRAGRRGEAIAASLTLCRAQPHDRGVFENPGWVFRNVVAPTVRLESEIIVRRHVHAHLLALALRGATVTRVTCAGFFEPQGSSVYEQVVARWRRLSSDAQERESIATDLTDLVSGTPLAGVVPSDLVTNAAGDLEVLAATYRESLALVVADLERVGSKPERPGSAGDATTRTAAIQDLNRQKTRIQQEFLLSFLINHRFLPAHGFPTDVIPFNPMNFEKLKARRAEGATDERRPPRDDNRLVGPSRPRYQAMREYAPGARIVIKGLVHESRGVTLNWHRPPSRNEGPTEVQSMRWYFRCGVCERAGHSHASQRPIDCPSCGARDPTTRRYLEPAGFAVDIWERPSNDLSSRVYPRRPEEFADLVGEVEWKCEAVGVRYDPAAELMSLQVPSGGKYRVCLVCGRVDRWMDQAESRKDVNAEVAPVTHRPLRGRVDADQGDHCYGDVSRGTVITEISLGARRRTSVLELRLRSTGEADLTKPSATALAFAIRESAVVHLGVEAREIGVIPPREKGVTGGEWSLQLYDMADGGSGICGRVHAELSRVLAGARTFLDCPECDSFCHRCLLGYDSQHHQFDRRGAQAYFETVLSQVHLS